MNQRLPDQESSTLTSHPLRLHTFHMCLHVDSHIFTSDNADIDISDKLEREDTQFWEQTKVSMSHNVD